MIKLSNAFKNGKSLQWSIDNPEMVDGMAEHLEMLEENEKEQLLEMFFTELSWLDYYNMCDLIKEQIDDPDTPEEIKPDFDRNNGGWYLDFNSNVDNYLFLDHVSGYHLSYQVGEEKEAWKLSSFEDQEMLDSNDNEDRGKMLTFIGTVGNLSEELGLQADNGACAYHHIGPGFFEVWIDSRFYKGDINA